MSELPHGTVTLLFSDIEGSTRPKRSRDLPPVLAARRLRELRYVDGLEAVALDVIRLL